MPSHNVSLAGNTGGSSVSTDQTIPFTVGANSNRHLTLYLSVIANSFPIGGVTYNGVAMTNRQEKIHGSESFLRMQCWDIVGDASIATGTHDVVINVTGACRLAWTIVSTYDVDPTTPRGSFSTAEGNSTGPSVTVTSASGELVIDGTTPSGTRTLTQDASQSLNDKIETFDCVGSSREAGAGSVVMSWTMDVAALWISIGFPLKPPSAPLSGSLGQFHPELRLEAWF